MSSQASLSDMSVTEDDKISVHSGRSMLGEDEDEEDEIKGVETRERNDTLTIPNDFVKFARLYFQDKSKSAYKAHRTALIGPLLKQVWGDGDSQRVLSSWEALLRFIGDWPAEDDEVLSDLQRVRLIADIGIVRSNTRDEIFCQICKQVTENPNKISEARSWILMGIMVGLFAPSATFLPVLQSFLLDGPPAYAPFISNRLQRTVDYGPRKEPPTSLEIQAAFTKKPIEITVEFYVGSQKLLVDPKTTAKEIIDVVTRNPLLHPEPGFGLTIATPEMDTVTALDGSAFVMDAISQLEAISSFKNDWKTLVEARPWKLFYRKQMFLPWKERGEPNLELLYRQCVADLSCGYLSISKGDLPGILAKLAFLEYGNEADDREILKLIRSKPCEGLHVATEDDWVNSTLTAFDTLGYDKESVTPDEVKREIVMFCRENLVTEFSRAFNNCDVKINNQDEGTLNVRLNRRGIQIVEESKFSSRAGATVIERDCINFGLVADISEVVRDRKKESFTITTVVDGGKTYKFTYKKAQLMKDLFSSIYANIKRRSKYVMALGPAKGGQGKLTLEPNDIISLPKSWMQTKGKVRFGVCTRTKRKGSFHIENVVVLPFLMYPSKEDLTLITKYHHHSLEMKMTGEGVNDTPEDQ